MIALKLFQVNILNHISKNYYMFFMTWFSKTWTQMNIQFLNLTLFCSRLGMPSFIFPSLDNDRTIQDLVFQVLKPFGVINFSIRPKEELWFSCLGLPRHDHKKMIVKTWQTNFWNLTLFCSRLGLPSFEMLHCFANICKSMFPIIGIDCTIQDLVFLVLNPFWGN